MIASKMYLIAAVKAYLLIYATVAALVLVTVAAVPFRFYTRRYGMPFSTRWYALRRLRRGAGIDERRALHPVRVRVLMAADERAARVVSMRERAGADFTTW